MAGKGDEDVGDARYVFGVTIRLHPDAEGVWAEPNAFETTVYRRADPPGEDGWLYFRDNLWHGELGDEAYFREIVEETLEAPVASVDFRELRTDEAYLDALRAEIATDLDLFNDSSVDKVLSKYLGSSIHVTDSG